MLSGVPLAFCLRKLTSLANLPDLSMSLTPALRSVHVCKSRLKLCGVGFTTMPWWSSFLPGTMFTSCFSPRCELRSNVSVCANALAQAAVKRAVRRRLFLIIVMFVLVKVVRSVYAVVHTYKYKVSDFVLIGKIGRSLLINFST